MKWLARAFLLLLVVGLTSCSSFRREWNQARAKPASAGDRFAGAWEGSWQSASHRGFSGKPMGGRLQGVLTPESGQQYRAHFNAQWLIFTSSYVVRLQSERRGDELRFRGTHDLGALFGGVYRYEGRATPDRFAATYDSSYDRGTFQLQRSR